jgi:hypothetical protein
MSRDGYPPGTVFLWGYLPARELVLAALEGKDAKDTARALLDATTGRTNGNADESDEVVMYLEDIAMAIEELRVERRAAWNARADARLARLKSRCGR